MLSTVRTPTRMSSNFDIQHIDTQARKLHATFLERKKTAEGSRKVQVSHILKKVQEGAKGLETDLRLIAQDELKVFQTKSDRVESPTVYTIDSDVIIDE
jgi:hypothetical protein